MGFTSLSYLYSIQVSITSSVKTSPLSRNSWSLLEALERLVQRAGQLGNVLQLLGRHAVDVLVERLARVDLVLDAVEAGHEHGREGEVAVAGRVRRAELDALGLRAGRVHRDADRRRAVARPSRPGSPAPRSPAPAACSCSWSGCRRRPAPGRASGCRRCSTAPCRDMPAYPSPAKSGLPPFQIDWWKCMPEPLSPKSGLGMKVTVLPCRRATFLTMYLNHISLSAMLQQRVEAHVDLGLAGGGDLVVLALDLDADASMTAHISVRMSCWLSVGAPGSSPPCSGACSRGCRRPLRGRCSTAPRPSRPCRRTWLTPTS